VETPIAETSLDTEGVMNMQPTDTKINLTFGNKTIMSRTMSNETRNTEEGGNGDESTPDVNVEKRDISEPSGTSPAPKRRKVGEKSIPTYMGGHVEINNGDVNSYEAGTYVSPESSKPESPQQKTAPTMRRSKRQATNASYVDFASKYMTNVMQETSSAPVNIDHDLPGQESAGSKSFFEYGNGEACIGRYTGYKDVVDLRRFLLSYPMINCWLKIKGAPEIQHSSSNLDMNLTVVWKSVFDAVVATQKESRRIWRGPV